MSRVLLAGESWMTTQTHVNGFGSFTTSSYVEGAGACLAALRAAGHEVTYIPDHYAAERFLHSGANTLLLHRMTLLTGQALPNRWSR